MLMTKDQPECLYNYIARQALYNPHSTALFAANQVELSYANLYHHIQTTIRTLYTQGIKASDPIAILLPEGPELAVACLTIASGFTCAPLNPAYSENELSFYLQDINAKALIIMAGTQAPDAAITLGLDIFEIMPATDAPAGLFTLLSDTNSLQGEIKLRSQAIALILHTSGTTAQAKCVQLSHENICLSANNIAQTLELKPSDRCLTVMPLFHIHGLSTLFASLVSGSSIIIGSEFSAQQFFKLIDSYQPSWYSAAPSIHQIILDSTKRYPGCTAKAKFRFIRSASAAMPETIKTALERIFNTSFIEAYGMTEAAPLIASNRLPPFRYKPGSVGQAAGTEIMIVDHQAHPVATHVIGEIAVRGGNIALANQSPGKWLHTGDLGYLDSEGYLFITGRSKDIINRGGEKIMPQELEAVILKHPVVAQAVVFGIPHEILGENIAAAIVLKQGFEGVLDTKTLHQQLLTAIREFIGQQLAYFKIPQQMVIVDKLPTLHTGKLQRKLLAEQFNISTPVRNATNPIHQQIIEIWRAVLDIDHLGISENFFQLGGHSLTATQVTTRLEQAFNIKVSLDTFFAKPTVAELADYINHAKKSTLTCQIKQQKPMATAPLSFTQQRLWFLNQLDNSSSYNMSIPLWLTGPVNEHILSLSLEEIQHRHQILRTNFQLIDDEPVQVISEHPQSKLIITDISTLAPQEREPAALTMEKEAASTPFDLASEPLLRTRLIRLSPARYLLLLTMHHIISDAWSTTILHHELGVIYQALLKNKPIPLAPLAIQYSDFAIWQRQHLNDALINKQLSYWQERLNNAPPLLTLPMDRPRPAVQSHQGARLEICIETTLAAGLINVARHENVTLFMLLLAGLQTLLMRYSGQDDIIVASPVANRSPVETEALIGFFANTLILRSDLSNDPYFSDLLQQVRGMTLAAYANRDLPLDKLIESLAPKRDLSHEQLFQVMFAFQNISDQTTFNFTPELSAEVFQGDRSTAKFDLTLYLSETEQGISGAWQYNTDIFGQATIARLNQHFQVLLAGIANNPKKKLSQLPLLDSHERHKLIKAWNPEEIATHQPDCFVQIFQQQVIRSPQSIALEYNNEQLTYLQLNQKANQLAHYLLEQKLSEGSLIGIALPRSIEMLVAVIAILKAGGAYVPLNPDYPENVISNRLRSANVSALISKKNLRTFNPSNILQIDLDSDQLAIARHANLNLDTVIKADSIAYVIYTSGSTGEAKGVMVSHANLASYIWAMHQALPITAADCYLHTASITFSSSVRQFILALTCGAKVHIATSDSLLDPLALFQLIQAYKISVIDLVPSYSRTCLQVINSLEANQRKVLLTNHLRLIVSASEPLSTDIPRGWQAVLPHSVQQINMYGQTETTGIVSTYSIPTDIAEGKIVPIGKPITSARIYLLDRQRHIVPTGVLGEIYIGGSGVAYGYLNQTELTDKHFFYDPFSDHIDAKSYKSGDMARYHADGTIEFVGRIDNQLKVRGFRIEPESIEALLRTHVSVNEAVSVAQGQRLLAFVVFKPGHRQVDLRSFLKNKLPDYMLPAAFIAVDNIPLTTNGKFDRKALANQQTTLANTDKYLFKTAATVNEKILAQIWMDILKLDSVSVNDNFFALGGDSILSVQVVLQANKAGLNINLQQLFQYQNIAELAAHSDLHIPAIEKTHDVDEIPVPIEKLRTLGIAMLEQAGLTKEGAAIVTEVQIESSLRGQQTHNMGDIPRYARRLKSGILNPQPNIHIEKQSTFSAQLNGDNAPGQWVATVAMQTAIQKAKTTGLGVVAVRRSNHFGAAAHYVWMAAQQGLIAIVTTNGPLILAPTGGVTPTFGNNPIGIGLPAKSHQPILLDIALSAVPRGKVGLDLAEGNPLMSGWILDRFGRPSTDLADLAAGLAVPIGGHKGSGLALSMEALAGVLTGAGFCWDHNRHGEESKGELDLGHFMIVLDPELFMPITKFTSRIDRLVEQTKTGDRGIDVEDIRVPGEYEMLARSRHLNAGTIPLRASTHRALLSYAHQIDLIADF